MHENVMSWFPWTLLPRGSISLENPPVPRSLPRYWWNKFDLPLDVENLVDDKPQASGADCFTPLTFPPDRWGAFKSANTPPDYELNLRS